MSKAFVREDNNSQDDQELQDENVDPIPFGTKNYMTPAGASRLQEELRNLLHIQRPEVVRVVAWAAGNGDRSENADYIYGKRRLREIDRRIRFLTRRLESVEIVDPIKQKSDKVLFGATVTVNDEAGNQKTYSIVGVDEVNVDRHCISWHSPIGKALLGARVEDVVSFHTPAGLKELEIVSIQYLSLE